MTPTYFWSPSYTTFYLLLPLMAHCLSLRLLLVTISHDIRTLIHVVISASNNTLKKKEYGASGRIQPNMYWVSPYYVPGADQSAVHVSYNSILTIASRVRLLTWTPRKTLHTVSMELKPFGSMRSPPKDHCFKNIFFDLLDLAKFTKHTPQNTLSSTRLLIPSAMREVMSLLLTIEFSEFLTGPGTEYQQIFALSIMHLWYGRI